MKNTVMIKSFQNGISVKMDPDIPFQDLYTEVARKFRESEKFFGDAKVVMSFEGRELDQDEEMLLINAITDNSKLQILCLIGNDEEKNQSFLKARNQFINDTEDTDGQYYKGTLRAGQVLETDASIIILGDVNPGANVISAGNIIVLGTLYGHAHAGARGNIQTFIVALDMQSNKLRIGDCDTMSNVKNSKWLRTKAVPKIAYVSQGEICTDAITKELLNDLPL
ncbi:MAG TPA: septum site-determining protein MinC [Lachnospiraceae bacterium]|nr:septum site-determining protein MinC [Lachnospiraceae bacterium]